MRRILVFSGGADYADPWHPFAETNAIIAEVLREEGDVTVVDTLDDLAARIDGADLLVINAGGGTAPHPLDARLAEILAGYGGPLLVLHVAATLLPEHAAWEARLGGRWVRDVSFHPERGPLRVRAVSASVADLAALDTVDEAHTALRVSPRGRRSARARRCRRGRAPARLDARERRMPRRVQRARPRCGGVQVAARAGAHPAAQSLAARLTGGEQG